MIKTKTLKFRCKLCDSTHFGSSKGKDGFWKYYCHDENGFGCSASFDESESWTLFRLEEYTEAENEKEFEELKKLIRD